MMHPTEKTITSQFARQKEPATIEKFLQSTPQGGLGQGVMGIGNLITAINQ